MQVWDGLALRTPLGETRTMLAEQGFLETPDPVERTPTNILQTRYDEFEGGGDAGSVVPRARQQLQSRLARKIQQQAGGGLVDGLGDLFVSRLTPKPRNAGFLMRAGDEAKRARAQTGGGVISGLVGSVLGPELIPGPLGTLLGGLASFLPLP